MYGHVSRDGMRLHLSSHHDDGTPGTAVLVEVRNIDALHSELPKRGYPFFNPGIAMVRGASGRCSSLTCLQPDVHLPGAVWVSLSGIVVGQA